MQRSTYGTWELKGLLPSGHVRFDAPARSRKHEVVPEWPKQAYAQFQRRLEETGQLSLLRETLKELVASTSHSDAIAGFITEAVSRSRLELGLTVTTQRLAQVQRRVSELERWQEQCEGRLAALEAVAPEKAVLSDIDWGLVHDAVLDAAAALGWQTRVELDADGGRVRVLVPEEQEDLLVDTSLEFYEKVSGQLGVAFRAIAFELDVDE